MSTASPVCSGRAWSAKATAVLCLVPLLLLLFLNVYSAWVLIPAFLVMLVLAILRKVPGVVAAAFGVALVLSFAIPLAMVTLGTDEGRITNPGGAQISDQ